MKEIAIELRNVSKTFENLQSQNFVGIKINHSRQISINALNDISFSVESGTVLGIIGLNGSGKSTLLRLIAGIYEPSKGEVICNGKLSPLMQLGLGFQNDLTAKENVILNGMFLGLRKKEIQNKLNKIIQYAEIDEFANLKLKYFSSGMRARLAFATSLEINPDILLVDEVLSVGDKDFQKKSYESFISLKNSNKTILHSSHNIPKLLEFSDNILLLHKGNQIMIGPPDKVVEKYRSITSSS